MNNDFRHIEAFEAYFNNELAASEKTTFEDRLKSDIDFKNEYDLYLELQHALTELGDEKLKISLEGHHQHYLTHKNINTNDLKFKIYIGGLVLFLTLICALILLHPEKTSKARIEAQTAHVESYKNITRPSVVLEVESLDSVINPLKKHPKNKKPVVKNDTLYFTVPLKKYEFPTTPKFQMDKSTLHLYGITLQENAYIKQEQTNLYLINNSDIYPIGETRTITPLERINKRMYESVISKKHTQKINTISHIVSELDTPSDSIELLMIRSEKLKEKYIFNGKKLIIDKLIKQMKLVKIEENHYIITKTEIYPLEVGEYLWLIPSIDNEFKPTLSELNIINKTVEQESELQNSN